MKPHIHILSMLALVLAAPHMHADAQKANTNIDFNKMIDENDTSDLQKQLANKMDSAKSPETTKAADAADKKKVLDFVDVEIGLGEDRPVVDRRFNSVTEPRVASEFSVSLLPKKGQ